MKPSFALNLTHDGIGLLHRTGSGWLSVGEVPLDAPDLAAALAAIRRTALGLVPQGIVSKIVIPATQVLYLSIDAPGPDAARRRAQIARALEGRTPYAPADLVFDWSGTGRSVRVAVVARETLAEAAAFAELHRFNPVSFVSIPPTGAFGGEPFFGLTRNAAHYLPEGARLDRDQDPVRILGIAAPRAADTASDGPGVMAAQEPAQAEQTIQAEPAADNAPEAATAAAPVQSADLAPAPANAPEHLPISIGDLGASAEAATDTGDHAAPASAEAPAAQPQVAPDAAPAAPAPTATPPRASKPRASKAGRTPGPSADLDTAPGKRGRQRPGAAKAEETRPARRKAAAARKAAKLPLPEGAALEHDAPAAPFVLGAAALAAAQADTGAAAATPAEPATDTNDARDQQTVPETAADIAPPGTFMPLPDAPGAEAAAPMLSQDGATAPDPAAPQPEAPKPPIMFASRRTAAGRTDAPTLPDGLTAPPKAPLAPPAKIVLPDALTDHTGAPRDATPASDKALAPTWLAKRLSAERVADPRKDKATAGKPLRAPAPILPTLRSAAKPGSTAQGGAAPVQRPILPASTAPARKTGTAHRLGAFASSAAAKGSAAGQALARRLAGPQHAGPAAAVPSAKPVPPLPPAREPELASNSVFGARMARPVRRSSAYIGVLLSAALVLFMGIVAVWSLFLGPPAPVAPPTATTAGAPDASTLPAPAAVASAPSAPIARPQSPAEPQSAASVPPAVLTPPPAVATTEVPAVADDAPAADATASLAETTAPLPETSDGTETAAIAPVPADPLETAEAAPLAAVAPAPGDTPAAELTAPPAVEPAAPAAAALPLFAAPLPASPRAPAEPDIQPADPDAADLASGGDPTDQGASVAPPQEASAPDALVPPLPQTPFAPLPSLSGAELAALSRDAAGVAAPATATASAPSGAAATSAVSPPLPIISLPTAAPSVAAGEPPALAPAELPPAMPLVDPTPEGTAMPGGFTLFAGRPDPAPGPRPAAITAAVQQAADAAAAAIAAEAAALAAARPLRRPGGTTTAPATAPAPVEPTPEDPGAALPPPPPDAATATAVTGEALTGERAALAALRPALRPTTITAAAATAAAARASAAERLAAGLASATPQAAAASPRPAARPRAVTAAAAEALNRALAEAMAAPAAAPAAANPDLELDEPEVPAVVSSGATPTSVAAQATQTNAIDLSELTLVGLFGAAGARRALLRLPSGRFQTVEVGDRVDGGQVVAISETQMTYVKSGQTITLKLLQSN